ncbi:MAG: hypothetical protein Tsb0015_15230 [Simkaniaceae bacterium]
MQLDEKGRGFSFQEEGPLDMRMDPRQTLTAEEIVNEWPEKELAMIIKEYGEEPRWKKAAKAIVAARKDHRIKSTKELAAILSQALKTKVRMRLHPATLVFQALRMAVNKELISIEEGIKKALHLLAPQGKIAVISFHRLEDRIVKNIFRNYAKAPEGEARDFLLRLLTKKPMVPSLAEIRANRRSRSAKLRVAEKVTL